MGRKDDIFVRLFAPPDLRNSIESGYSPPFFRLGMQAYLWFIARLGQPVKKTIVLQGNVYRGYFFCVSPEYLIDAKTGRPVGSDDTCGAGILQYHRKRTGGIACLFDALRPSLCLRSAIFPHFFKGLLRGPLLPVIIRTP